MYDIILRKIVAKTADKLKNTFNSKKSSFCDFFYNQKIHRRTKFVCLIKKNQPKRRITKNSCMKKG